MPCTGDYCTHHIVPCLWLRVFPIDGYCIVSVTCRHFEFNGPAMWFQCHLAIENTPFLGHGERIKYSAQGRAIYQWKVMEFFLPHEIEPFFKEPSQYNPKDWWHEWQGFHEWRRSYMMWHTPEELQEEKRQRDEDVLRDRQMCERLIKMIAAEKKMYRLERRSVHLKKKKAGSVLKIKRVCRNRCRRKPGHSQKSLQANDHERPRVLVLRHPAPAEVAFSLDASACFGRVSHRARVDGAGANSERRSKSASGSDAPSDGAFERICSRIPCNSWPMDIAAKAEQALTQESWLGKGSVGNNSKNAWNRLATNSRKIQKQCHQSSQDLESVQGHAREDSE